MEYWGFKNVQGQFWAHLTLSETPLDTAELMRRTGVSKGLASIYLKEMLQYEVIEEVGRASHGTVLYRANPNQDQVIFNVLRKRERVLISQAQEAWKKCESLSAQRKKEGNLSEVGLKQAGDLIQHTSTVIDLFIRSQETVKSIVQRIRKSFTLPKT